MPENTHSPDFEEKLQAITHLPGPSAKFVDGLWVKMEAQARTNKAKPVSDKPVWGNIFHRIQTAGQWAIRLAAIGLLIAVIVWAIGLRPQDTPQPISGQVNPDVTTLAINKVMTQEREGFHIEADSVRAFFTGEAGDWTLVGVRGNVHTQNNANDPIQQVSCIFVEKLTKKWEVSDVGSLCTVLNAQGRELLTISSGWARGDNFQQQPEYNVVFGFLEPGDLRDIRVTWQDGQSVRLTPNQNAFVAIHPGSGQVDYSEVEIFDGNGDLISSCQRSQVFCQENIQVEASPQAPIPWPTAVPVEAFPTPAVVELAVTQTEGSPWTTYIPHDWQTRVQQNQETPSISAILAAPDGSTWFATMGGAMLSGTGVYRYDGQAWTHYTIQNGLPANEISAMATTPDGALWFGTLCCGAARYDGQTWTTITTEHGLASNDIRSLAVAPDGAIWFGTGDQGVSRFDGSDWETFTRSDGLYGNFVGGIFTLPDDSLLFSTSNGLRASLDRFDGQSWSTYPTDWTKRGRYTQNMAYSPDGELWFTTEFDGVYRLAADTWSHFTGQNGLPSSRTRGLIVAQNGTVWAGTDQGVARFDGQDWTIFSAQAGLASNWITALAAAKDGSIWVGMNGGISRYTGTDFASPVTTETTQPTLREMPMQLPAGLTVEEYALAGGPGTEPWSFTPVVGTAAGILGKHPVSEREPVYFSNRIQLGTAELVASENYNQTGSEGWISVEQDGTEIYRIDTGPGSPITALRGLWVYDGQWVLETARISLRREENTVYTDAVGRISQDGELLNTRYGYEEMFGFQIMAGRPFYFFKQDGQIGFSYDGQAVTAGYDTVPHYGCCSAGALNPHQSTNMVAFFAQMDGRWYYVEIGVYE